MSDVLHKRGRPPNQMIKPDESTVDKAIWHFGSVQQMAQALGIKDQTVYEWRRFGVNQITTCLKIENASDGAINAAEFIKDMRRKFYQKEIENE